jgi:two-component system chemotaxis response regulator CheY
LKFISFDEIRPTSDGTSPLRSAYKALFIQAPESDMHSILAVDDSASMRQMVSFTLKSAGYNVVEAVDGQDALEKAGGRSFDLVLTDQNMPRMDGISLTKKLRESPQFKTTPILILTTESSDQMKQAGRAAGATGWLVKPFDPNKLIEVIQKVIR